MAVDVPTAPPLGRVANVELMHTGTWTLSTGLFTFTIEDLAAAVAALECPAVRRPALKFGHTPDAAPGQPAIGFVANMATAENGRTLVGDFVGMPGWLVDTDADGNSVLSSAYPDRSIEGAFDFRCQIGHTHPFVIKAVALLGEEEPGIGTIQSLQDLADLYGVAASADPGDAGSVAVIVRASEGSVMPNPRPVQVSATVTTEDVRRAFYSSPAGAGWSTWIEEMQLEPLQLIVMDDDTNTRSRVPVNIGDGEGQEAVSFADAVPVIVRYDDAAQSAAAAAGAQGGRRIRFASRTESRPAPTASEAAQQIAAAAKKNPPAAAAGVTPSEKGAGMDPAKIREALGLGPDASDDEVRTAWASTNLAAAPPSPSTEPTSAPPAPAADAPTSQPDLVAASKKAVGTMTIDASAWDEREQRIKRLEADAAKRAREERDQVIAEAVKDGKFAPARKDHWVRLWDADPEGTRQVIAGLTKNVIPVEAIGFAGGDDEDFDQEFASLFPPAATTKGA
jgi:hypothetical protein